MSLPGAWTPKDDAALRASMDSAPKHLYHYMHWDMIARTRLAISHGEVLFGSPSRLNDPFDCRARITSGGAEPEVIRSFWERHLAEAGRTMSAPERARIEVLVEESRTGADELLLAASVRESVDACALLCFSEDPTQMLMWAHYAHGHEGVCLRFRTDIDGWDQLPSPMMFKVRYSREFPVGNFYLEERYALMQLMLGTKAIDWEYEREWRLLLRDHQPGPVRFAPGIIDGVILGLKCDAKTQHLITSWVSESNRGIEILRINQRLGTYNLEVI